MSIVDEVLGGPTYENLRIRAREAKQLAESTRELAEAELRDDLQDHLWAFMRDQLGVPAGDLAGATFEFGLYGVTPGSMANPIRVRNQFAAVKVDDVKIRARYTATSDWEVGGNVMFEYQGRSLGWHSFVGLAHLGQIMAVNG